MHISFRCPSCGERLDAPADLAGRRAVCSFCNKQVRVPFSSDEALPTLRGRFRCPFCGTSSVPQIRTRVSVAGWVFFVVLFLSVVGTLFCWIPFLFCYEEYRTCIDCGCKLGG